MKTTFERHAAFLTRHRIPAQSGKRLGWLLLPLLLISIPVQLTDFPGKGFIYPFTLVLTNLILMILLWRAALKYAGWVRAGWVSISLFVTLILVAMVLWVFVYPNGAMRDSIGLPEVLYLFAGALAWLGFVFLRLADGANRRFDIRTLLDVAVMALAGTVFAWHFLIQPYSSEFLSGLGSGLRNGLGLASIVEVSPFLNIVLFTLASQVLLQRNARQPSHLFAVGILLITAADVSMAFIIKDAAALNTYFSGAWTLGIAVLTLDASRTGQLPQRRKRDALGAARPDPVSALRLLPYLAALACIVLSVLSSSALLGSTDGPPPGWRWLINLVFLLLMVRQVITLIDNQQLARKLIAANKELAYQAGHDPLTGLLNRMRFSEQLERSIRQAEAAGTQLALFFLDLDDFKEVNDAYGHLFGDELLVQVSARLREAAAPLHGYAARLGGDEFVIAVPGLATRSVGGVADSFLAAFVEPYELMGESVRLGVSIGVSLFPDDGHDAYALFHHADSAMYRSKRGGKARFSW